MKLGTQTASVINHLQSRATIGQPRPVVGMGATILCWTDRLAATIVSVIEIGGSKVWSFEIEVVEDKYRVTEGSTHDGSAKFEFTPDADGYRNLYRFNKKTQAWVAGYINKDTGRFCAIGNGLRIGSRDKHVDPSF